MLLNNGNGSFAPKLDIAAGADPVEIMSQDFNGDARLDYVILDGAGDIFTIYLNVDTTPDAFSFTDQTGVALSTLATSNTLTITGLGAAATISITGGEYSINGGAFTTANGSVSNNDTVAVRHTSSAAYFMVTDTVVTIGGVSDTFSSTTITDTVPDVFSFTDQTGVTLNAQITSNTLTITGLGATAAISITAGEYSVNGGAFTAIGGLINNNDTLAVRHTSSAAYFTVTDTVVTIGGVSDTFSTTTITDTVPDVFSFTDQTDLALSTLATSNTLTITGLGAAATISITGGEYSINGGAFTTANGSVSNNDTVTARHTSSANYLTATDTVVTIGGVSDTFSSTTMKKKTVDKTPDFFVFSSQSNVSLNSQITSDAVKITGMNATTYISIAAGEYSINGAAFTAADGVVNNNSSVRVRHISSASHNATTDTVVTIGGIVGSFSSTTSTASAFINNTEPTAGSQGNAVPEPVISEPVISKPVISEPVISEPVISEPVISESVISEPETAATDIKTPETITETRSISEAEIIAPTNGGGPVSVWGLVILLVALIGRRSKKQSPSCFIHSTFFAKKPTVDLIFSKINSSAQTYTSTAHRLLCLLRYF